MKKLINRFLLLFFTVIILPIYFCPASSAAAKLNFVQLSDIHYSLERPDNAYKLLSKTKPLLEDAIKEINSEKKLDFVIITGDGIDRPNKESLYSLIDDLNNLKYPWYYVIGNHDTTPFDYLNKDNFIKILNEKNKNFKFDSTYYTFTPKKGYRVIVLDGALNDKIGSAGYIPKEELDWLDNLLEKSKNKTVLIFIHFPIITPFSSKSHEIINAKEFSDIINKYEMPTAVFSGHYHMTKITKRRNVLHVSTPSLAGYPNAFRVIKVTNTKKSVIFDISLKETGLKDIQKQAKITALGGSLYYGREADRNISVIINKKR